MFVFPFLQKQATLMRRSTIFSPSVSITWFYLFYKINARASCDHYNKGFLNIYWQNILAFNWEKCFPLALWYLIFVLSLCSNQGAKVSTPTFIGFPLQYFEFANEELRGKINKLSCMEKVRHREPGINSQHFIYFSTCERVQ